MKRSQVSAVLFMLLLVVAASAVLAPTRASPSPSTGIVIPLYTSPTDGTWAATIQVKAAHPSVPFIVIVDASNNGAGLSFSSAWATGIANFQAAGITVIGYDATGWASRALSGPETEALHWWTWYHVNGIFFDEMQNVPGSEAYYTALNAYVKGLGMTYTMGNPGTSISSGYYGILDSLLIYENPHYPTMANLASYSAQAKSSLGYIAYGVSLDAAYETSSTPYMGWIWITDLGGGNPYNGLPSYFAQEVAILDTSTTLPVVTTTTTTTTSTAITTLPLSGIWQPPLVTSWNWQLSTHPTDLSGNLQMYDIDAFDNPASQVAAIHAIGAKAVCYISAGTAENWRPDYLGIPVSVLGNNVAGWAGEKWLDVRQLEILGPIMTARMDLCVAKGFDGIEVDNIDAYSNPTGFPLTYQDQLNYNILLADAAHARNLSIALKNDVGQVNDLVSHFDWALDESCFNFNECQTLLPFISAGKAVFQVQYDAGNCAQANLLNFNGLLKHQSLDAYVIPCRTSATITTTTTAASTSSTTTTTTTSTSPSVTTTIVTTTIIDPITTTVSVTTTRTVTYSGGPLYTFMVKAVNQFNQPAPGFWVILYDNYNRTVGTGFTSASWSVPNGVYMIQVDGYGTCLPSGWKDGGVITPTRSLVRAFLIFGVSQSLTVVLTC